jgi:DNA-binding XRE family transcriptional regulator
VPGPFADDGKCQEFVGNLKRMRDLFGWSQEDLAVHAHVGKGTVAMTESFQRAPQVDHGMAYDEVFGLKDMFTKAAREIQGQSFPESFQDFPAHEAAAHDLYIYEHSVFPGLVQTERYMRAVLASVPNIRADEVERRVTGRLARQEILRREDIQPPRLWALVDEAALRRPVADAAVMYEQCMHALEVSRLPHVSLAVVPYAERWHVGLLGACTIVERDGTARMVNVEDIADGRVSEDPATVRRVALRFRSLQHEALPGGDSQDMIARMAEELWNRTAPSGARALTAVATEGSA